MSTSRLFCCALVLLGSGGQALRKRVEVIGSKDAKRISWHERVKWIRTVLVVDKRFDDDDIADASRFVKIADDLIRGFDRVKSALGDTSAAGPFTGQVLEHYTIGKKIGEGQWGQVYMSTAGDSVIKVDKRDRPLRNMDQLAHEAQVQSVAHEANISVPAILAVGTISTPGGSHDAIAMSFAGGKTLQYCPFAALTASAQHVAARGIIFNLAKLLLVGIVNSDQGKQNIMALASGSVTLIDFGMARFRDELSPETFNREAQKMVIFALESVPDTATRLAVQDDMVSNALSKLPRDLSNLIISRR